MAFAQGTLGDKTGAHEAISTAVSAADFNSYTEFRYVNETLAAGTLKSMLTTLVSTYLSEYGVSLDGSQANGPTFPALTYQYRRVDDVLNELSTLSAKYGAPYVWKISHYKVLSMYQPSSSAAPFDITDGDGNTFGDIKVEQVRDKRYANKVIVKVPSKQIIRHPVQFTGDGSTTVFTMPDGYTIVKPYGYVENGAGQYETLTSNEGSGASWEYNISAGTLTALDGAPADGTAITFYTDVDYAPVGTASDAGEITAKGTREKIVTVDSVPSDTTAQALAEGELARSLVTPKTIKYKTKETGILPGQSQTITDTRRNLSAVSVVITNVTIKDYGNGNAAVREVTAVSGTTPIDDERGVLKLWAGDKTGGSVQSPLVEAGSATAVMAGPAPPDRAIQFRDGVQFGGKSTFLFYKDENSILCGADSAITAADFSHCAIFGQFLESGD